MMMNLPNENESLSEYYEVPQPCFFVKADKIEGIDFDCMNARLGTKLNPSAVKKLKRVVMPHLDAAEIIIQKLRQEINLSILSQQTGLSLSRVSKEVQLILTKRLYKLCSVAKYSNIITAQTTISLKQLQMTARKIIKSNYIDYIKTKYNLLWRYVIAQGRNNFYMMAGQTIKAYYIQLSSMLQFLKISIQIKKDMPAINIKEKSEIKSLIGIQQDRNSPTEVIRNNKFKSKKNIHKVAHQQAIGLRQDKNFLQIKYKNHKDKEANNDKGNKISMVKINDKRVIPARNPPNKWQGIDFTKLRKDDITKKIFRKVLNKILNDIVLKAGEQSYLFSLETKKNFKFLRRKIQEIDARKPKQKIIAQQFFSSFTILQNKALFEQFIVNALEDYPDYVKNCDKINVHMKQCYIKMAGKMANIFIQSYKRLITCTLPHKTQSLNYKLQFEDQMPKERQSYYSEISSDQPLEAFAKLKKIESNNCQRVFSKRNSDM